MYGIALKPAVSRASTFASNTTRPASGANVAASFAAPASSQLLSAANGNSRTATAPVVVHGELGAAPVANSSKRSYYRYEPVVDVPPSAAASAPPSGPFGARACVHATTITTSHDRMPAAQQDSNHVATT